MNGDRCLSLCACLLLGIAVSAGAHDKFGISINCLAIATFLVNARITLRKSK